MTLVNTSILQSAATLTKTLRQEGLAALILDDHTNDDSDDDDNGNDNNDRIHVYFLLLHVMRWRTNNDRLSIACLESDSELFLRY